MKPEVRAVLLVLLGAATLRISLFSDAYLRYVKAALHPYLIASGLVLVVLGVLSALAAARRALGDAPPAGSNAQGRRRRRRRSAPQSGHDHEHGHGHDHGPDGLRTAWLLVLPVLAILLIAPPALGSFTAQRSANTVVRPVSADAGFPALPAGDPLVMSLNEFDVRAVWDHSHALKGRRVKLTGFVTRGRDGTWYVNRLTISCCAADAQTHKAEVEGLAAPPADSWVEVIGAWKPNGQVDRDDAVPALTAQRVTRIPEPHDPYE